MNFYSNTEVELISNMDDIVRLVYTAYRQCYTKNPEKVKVLSDEEKTKLVEEYEVYRQKYFLGDIPTDIVKLQQCKFICDHLDHQSPLEHATFTFKVKGLSRVSQQQLTRHRLASYSITSQRYIAEMTSDEQNVYIPTAIERDSIASSIYKETVEKIFQSAQVLRDLGVKDEDIRYLYPSAMPSDIIMSFNLRSIMHFCNERCCTRAQTEIRLLANKIKVLLRKELPFIGAHIGSKCDVLGFCPESHSCGRMKQIDK